ncbi:MAG: hypothetical protein PWQ97_462 [Tepidanaerobacteraceae bacterium]|nr:hypothetical protein [Tepidanaerobacteraceae bacterium]
MDRTEMEFDLEGIEAGELSWPYKELCELVGLDDTIAIARWFGGLSVYFPKYETVLRQLRDKKMLQEFDGKNFRELAMKYGLSESMVRNIIGKNVDKPDKSNI